MNFQSGRENLQGAHKVLKNEWKRLNEHWKDSKADEFQKKIIERTERQIKASLHSIEEINELFKQIQEDCF